MLGFRVGTIKHVHHEGFSFDVDGKDTWRHARSGASIVAGVAPRELAIFKPTHQETSLNDVREVLNSEKLHLVLVEGFSRAPSTRRAHKIITAKDTKELRQILKLNGPPIIAITGPVAASRSKRATRRTLTPIVDLRADRGELVGIVRSLLRPNELSQLYRKAAVKHGDECVGLAVGLRGAYLASNMIGAVEAKPRLIYGTKKCVAEAFSAIFPGVHSISHGHDDALRIENSRSKLTIQLAPKRHFRNSREVLKCPDEQLFQSIQLERK
jgi:molybdopterin-guanine dinucleotide biosynthesis protein MobB